LNMELRDSGRDLVQIKDDGTHAILPVTSRSDVQPDHARVPVILLRHSDGKMRRDGSNAASMQPNTAVAERGRLHGAPGLAVVEEPRVLARIRGPCRNQERNGEWVRERRLVDRLRRQDKGRKVRTVGRGEEGSNFKHAPNVAQYRTHLSMFGKLLSPLNIRHPVSPR
jgi:hypothetical protein